MKSWYNRPRICPELLLRQTCFHCQWEEGHSPQSSLLWSHEDTEQLLLLCCKGEGCPHLGHLTQGDLRGQSATSSSRCLCQHPYHKHLASLSCLDGEILSQYFYLSIFSGFYLQQCVGWITWFVPGHCSSTTSLRIMWDLCGCHAHETILSCHAM